MNKVRRPLAVLLVLLAAGFGGWAVVRPILVRRADLPRLSLPVPLVHATEGCSVSAVAVSPDGTTVAGAQYVLYDSKDWQRKASVFLWDARTGRLLRTIAAHREAVTNVEFSPDGQLLMTTGADDALNVWRVNTGQLLWTRPNRANYFQSPRFSHDGSFLAAQYGVKGFRAWDAQTGRSRPLPLPPPVTTSSQDDIGDANFAFSPTGVCLAAPLPQHFAKTSGTKGQVSGGAVGIWDIHNAFMALTLPGARTQAIAFSPDGRRLASVRLTGTSVVDATTHSRVQVYDFPSGRLLWAVTFHKRAATSVAFVPGTHALAVLTVGPGTRTDILDADTGAWRRALSAFPTVPSDRFSATAYGLSVSRDGRTLAARDSRRVLVWDTSALAP